MCKYVVYNCGNIRILLPFQIGRILTKASRLYAVIYICILFFRIREPIKK